MQGTFGDKGGTVIGAMAGRVYHGCRTPQGAVVKVRRSWNSVAFPLSPRNDLWNHSPSGFEWNYNGSGPAQLALAILADLYDDDTALMLYQDFKREVIANIYPSEWWMLEDFVHGCVEKYAALHGVPIVRREEPTS